MNPDRWGQIKQIYHSALELEPGRREEFLREACAGDASLLKEVRSLLAQDRNPGGLFELPAIEAVAQALGEDRANEAPLAGRSLLHYRIEEKIGQGGMGEVYRARDTSLDRTVALKILPPAFVSDQDRMRRFVREAKAASALTHPNVATIFEVGQAEGIHFIAMEYVSGETLAEYSRKRKLEPGQIIDIAIQMADTLEEAQAKGVIHRDLKPANVMVTPRGQVKVLDFGLAKLARPAGEPGETSPSSLTERGLVIGTVTYMSPEQVLGRQLDHRTDIFSLGSILYELVTGHSPFAGGTTTEIMDRILHAEPQPSAGFNPSFPPELERIVRKCLEKDRELRYQHASDLYTDLKRLKRDTESGKPAPEVWKAERHPLLSVSLRLVVVGIAVVLLAAAGWYWLGRRGPIQPEAPLIEVPLTSYPGWEFTPSFSPDGNYVAFEWKPEGPGANFDIYIKQIGVEPPFRLTTDPADDISPAWSPDGRFIAFLRRFSKSRGALMLIPQRGGQERVLEELNLAEWTLFDFRTSDLGMPLVGWTPDSKGLVFPSGNPGSEALGLLLISVETRQKRRLTTLPARFFDGTPAFSPDGRILAFTRRRSTVRSGICFLRLKEDYLPQKDPPLFVTPDEGRRSGVAWTLAGTEIVFGSGAYGDHGEKGLWRMKASMDARPVTCAFGRDATSAPAISRRGNRLAYAVEKWDANIYRLDLSGPGPNPVIPFKFTSSTRNDYAPAYSPEGSKIAFSSDRSGSGEIWVCDRDGSNAAPLTSVGGQAPARPKWSPDGGRILFQIHIRGKQHILVINANGGVPRRLATELSDTHTYPSWSRDGQSIYFRSLRSGSSEIWKMPATGGDPVRITRNTGDLPEESPDGEFLYYMKGEEYPEQCSLWRMPTGGGEETRVVDSTSCQGPYAVWEKGIYFLTPSDQQGHRDINLYDFSTGKTRKIPSVELPDPMFIAVSPDGRTILYTKDDQAGSDLMLVENFH